MSINFYVILDFPGETFSKDRLRDFDHALRTAGFRVKVIRPILAEPGDIQGLVDAFAEDPYDDVESVPFDPYPRSLSGDFTRGGLYLELEMSLQPESWSLRLSVTTRALGEDRSFSLPDFSRDLHLALGASWTVCYTEAVWSPTAEQMEVSRAISERHGGDLVFDPSMNFIIADPQAYGGAEQWLADLLTAREQWAAVSPFPEEVGLRPRREPLAGGDLLLQFQSIG